MNFDGKKSAILDVFKNIFKNFYLQKLYIFSIENLENTRTKKN